MSNAEALRLDPNDPISTAATETVQAATQAADRAFQVGYMVQIMRSQRIQQALEHLEDRDRPDGRYRAPKNEAHARWLNETVETGDVVIVPGAGDGQERALQVTSVGEDGQVRAVDRTETTLSPGDYQVVRRADNPKSAPIEEGSRVTALDRGNVGTVVSIDGDQALVRFTNKETGATADVTMDRSQLRATDQPTAGPAGGPQTKPGEEKPVVDGTGPKQELKASGLLRSDGQPDPDRIKKNAATGRRPGTNRPSTFPTNGPRPRPGPQPPPPKPR